MSLSQDALLRFLKSDLLMGTEDIQPETLLFSSGLIDSISMMELVVFIEEQAGFRVGAADLTLENVDSVSRILAFVQRRTAG